MSISIMAKALGARGVAFPISSLASVSTTALIISRAGAESYATIMLVGTVFTLLPFADLGAGAVIVNTFSRPGVTLDERRQVASKVFRVLLYAAMTLALTSWLGTFVWSWGRLLGSDRLGWDVDAATALGITLFGASIPLSIGHRMLVGAGKAVTSIYIAPAVSLFSLVASVLVSMGGFDVIWYSLVFPIGNLTAQLIGFAFGLRASKLRFRELLAPSDFPYRSILSTSAPMFVIMVSIPLTMNSHRIILAHVSTPVQLAEYSLVMQFYQPVWSFVLAAATPLWPTWTSLRRNPVQMRASFVKSLGLLGGIGIASLIGFVTLGGWLGALVSGGEIVLGPPILAGTGLLVMIQALQQAPGMYLTWPRALSIQSVCIAVAAMVAVVGSVLYGPSLGGIAPALATSAGVFVAQLVPGLFLVRQHLATAAGASCLPDEPAEDQ